MSRICPLSVSLLFFALLTGVAIPTIAADPVQSGIQKAYDGECAGLTSRNIAAATNFISADFVGTEPSNKLTNRGDLVESLSALIAQYRLGSCVTRIISVAQNLGQYTVSVEQTAEGATNSYPVQTVQAVSLQSDSWTEVAGNWRLSASVVTERTLRSNGLVVLHEVRQQNP